MTGKNIAALLSLLFPLAGNAALAADKVIISYSSRSYAFLPAQVAVAKGLFKDENLDALLIQMRSQVTVPALLSGEVHYTLSFGNIIGGAMQGLPFKILAVLTDKPLHSIVDTDQRVVVATNRSTEVSASPGEQAVPTKTEADADGRTDAVELQVGGHRGTPVVGIHLLVEVGWVEPDLSQKRIGLGTSFALGRHVDRRRWPLARR